MNWTNPTPYETTEKYCALEDKVVQAADSKYCEWPNALPTCDVTWMEYAGESAVTAGKAVWFILFFMVWVVQVRMNVFSWQRLQAKKKSYWDKTSNEWLSFYMAFIMTLRLIQEVDYECASFISFKVSFVITKVISGTLVSCLYTIAWGWHKVLLPTTNRAENVKKADRIHTVLRTATVFTEGFSGVLAVVLLPEDYSNAGVYVGTWHGISRAVLWVLCVALMTFIYKMGTNIKNALANGGQKKVAPEPAAGEKVVKKKGDDEKIAGMIKWTIGIMCIVLVYLLLDISRSIGKYRFVNEPFCEAKTLFVRLPSIIQLGTALAVTHVFPVKKPDVKGKTNMMGTTVVSTSSG